MISIAARCSDVCGCGHDSLAAGCSWAVHGSGCGNGGGVAMTIEENEVVVEEVVVVVS
jgi:hypothetical protein